MTGSEHEQLRVVLRSAWSAVRLDVLRGVVQPVILALSNRNPAEFLVPGLEPWDPVARSNPVAEALLTCCEELREGCALPKPAERGSVAVAQCVKDAAWAEAYRGALELYRRAAREALQVALNQLPLGTTQSARSSESPEALTGSAPPWQGP